MLDSRSIINRALSRRATLRGLAGFLAGSPLLRSEIDPIIDHSRVPALSEMRTVYDFDPVARGKVLRWAYDYLYYGCNGEFTLRRNREVFDWVSFVPRRAVDVSSVNAQINLLGFKMAYPIMVSPVSGHERWHPEGEMATHRGATAANTTYILSGAGTSQPMAKVMAAASGPMWYQLYAQPGGDYNRKTVEDAQAVGAQAIVITLDQQAPTYERTMHDTHLLDAPSLRPPAPPAPPAATATGLAAYRLAPGRLWQNWKVFDDLRPIVKGPLIPKGIVRADDALMAIEHGCDAIYISNHGGRSMDYGPSTLEVLPEIVDAVHGRVPVLIDSGFRRGEDILKALALGASAVCVGRAHALGVAAYGALGVQRVLEILQNELKQAMAANGRPTIASIDRTLVRTEFV